MNFLKLTILAIALCAGTSANATEMADSTTVGMGGRKPIIGSGQNPHKAPSRNQCPVTVYYDDERCQLILVADTPADVSYGVMREEDTELLSGTPAFTQGTATISLSGLPAGTYCLRLTVNDHSYYGEFDI